MLVIGALVTGCLIHPVYKKLQPAARMTVVGADGQPIENAAVTLIASSYPYGRERGRLMKLTDARGMVAFDSVRRWQAESFVIHGTAVYFWNWCVHKEGFATYETVHGRADEFQDALRLQLSPGKSIPCVAEKD